MIQIGPYHHPLTTPNTCPSRRSWGVQRPSQQTKWPTPCGRLAPRLTTRLQSAAIAAGQRLFRRRGRQGLLRQRGPGLFALLRQGAPHRAAEEEGGSGGWKGDCLTEYDRGHLVWCCGRLSGCFPAEVGSIGCGGIFETKERE